MSNYVRRRVAGGMYFLTLVSHQRQKMLTLPSSRQFLHQAIAEVMVKHPFELRAIVLLPDHLHMLMAMPEGDSDYSLRISLMKSKFTRSHLANGGSEGPGTPSRKKHRVRGVWEKRFYEHTIKNYRDYKEHLDYIHINPVRHGLARLPKDWPWSTFQRYVASGEYGVDWCGTPHLPGGVDIEPDTW